MSALDGIVVITGASSGIGRELARLFAPRARRLVLIARRAERLSALADELGPERTEVLPLDLRRVDEAVVAISELEARHGAIDVLVNDAGAGLTSLLEHADPETLRGLVALNADAPLALARRVLPGMIARRRGVILNVGSIAGLVPFPGFATYSASKHFLAAWSEAVGAEVASQGVLVSHAAPGIVETEFARIASGETFAGERLPGWLTQSAVDCARRIHAGVLRGRRVIHPSPRARLLVLLLLALPAPLRRLALERMAASVRARHEAARSEAARLSSGTSGLRSADPPA